jgi:myo-inositol-1(or 4)-monophosphatase
VSTPSLEALKSVALETAIAAGDLLSKGAQMKVNDSTDDDVKMQADVDSEHLVRALLKATGIPVIGEELGGDASLFDGNELYWVVDPLDGTYNYLRRQPATCVSLGLMRGSEPVLGVIHNFTANKTYLGVVGEGTFINGQRHTPGWVDQIGDACIMTGFPALADKSAPAMAVFMGQVSRYKKIRMIGSAALALAYVGEGVADTYYESGTNLWDVAAGLAIIKASGGHYRLVPTGKRPLNYDLWASAKEEWTR